MPFGAILGPVLGAVAGGLVSKATQPDAPQARSSFELLPPELQKISREAVFPLIQQVAEQQFPATLKTQAVDPSVDPFASRGLFQLQQAINAAPAPQAAPVQQAPQISGESLANQFLSSITPVGPAAGQGRGVNVQGQVIPFTGPSQNIVDLLAGIDQGQLGGALQGQGFTGANAFAIGIPELLAGLGIR